MLLLFPTLQVSRLRLGVINDQPKVTPKEKAEPGLGPKSVRLQSLPLYSHPIHYCSDKHLRYVAAAKSFLQHLLSK